MSYVFELDPDNPLRGPCQMVQRLTLVLALFSVGAAIPSASFAQRALQVKQMACARGADFGADRAEGIGKIVQAILSETAPNSPQRKRELDQLYKDIDRSQSRLSAGLFAEYYERNLAPSATIPEEVEANYSLARAYGAIVSLAYHEIASSLAMQWPTKSKSWYRDEIYRKCFYE